MSYLPVRHKLLWIPALLAALCTVGLDDSLSVAGYRIASEKITGSVRLVVVADLHSRPVGEGQGVLLSKIRELAPDLLLLAGDIIDDRYPTEGAEQFLEGIRDICPAYYVTGNHEYWSDGVEDVLSLPEQYGVRVLSDESVRLTVNGNDLILAGAEDPARRKYVRGYDPAKAMREAFGEMDDRGAYAVLLAHRPERIDLYKQYPFDLVVSGHAHGGQFRIPGLLNGLYAPNQGFFPKYAGGLYTHGQVMQVVSRGLANNAPVPRLFNPPELVVVDLEAAG